MSDQPPPPLEVETTRTTDPKTTARRIDQAVISVSAVGVVVLGGLTLLPLWAPLVFAVWTASLLYPLSQRIGRFFGNRPSIGAACSMTLVLSLFIPIGLVVNSLLSSAIVFGKQLMSMGAARNVVEAMVSPEQNGTATTANTLTRLVDLAKNHGGALWTTAKTFASAGASLLLVVFIFFVALYAFLVDGKEIWEWVVANSPTTRRTSERLAGAFLETGRGLIVGAGLTALVQAIVATIAYTALGVPRVGVLGVLTYVSAFIPAVGTAFVWIPIAAGFAVKAQFGKAILMLAIGGLGVSTIDNVVRPVFQRWGGKLNLPVYILLFAAFGGLAAFGAAGLALGPLTLRMTKEILEISRELREQSRQQNKTS